MSEPSECAGCGAPLPVGSGLREVACGFCGRSQEHPRPVAVRQEVMLSDGADGFDLGTVVACDGPDAISVQTDRGTETAKVEDLVRVARARVQAGDRVYAKQLIGWALVDVAAVDGDRVTVKHRDASFGDSFFDDERPLEHIRVPVERARRARRSRTQRWLARATSDPLGALFQLVRYSFALAIASVALWLAGLYLRAFLGWW